MEVCCHLSCITLNLCRDDDEMVTLLDLPLELRRQIYRHCAPVTFTTYRLHPGPGRDLELTASVEVGLSPAAEREHWACLRACQSIGRVSRQLRAEGLPAVAAALPLHVIGNDTLVRLLQPDGSPLQWTAYLQILRLRFGSQTADPHGYGLVRDRCPRLSWLELEVGHDVLSIAQWKNPDCWQDQIVLSLYHTRHLAYLQGNATLFSLRGLDAVSLRGIPPTEQQRALYDNVQAPGPPRPHTTWFPPLEDWEEFEDQLRRNLLQPATPQQQRQREKSSLVPSPPRRSSRCPTRGRKASRIDRSNVFFTCIRFESRPWEDEGRYRSRRETHDE